MDLWSRALVPAPRAIEQPAARRGRLRRSAGVIGLVMLLGIGGVALVATIDNTDQPSRSYTKRKAPGLAAAPAIWANEQREAPDTIVAYAGSPSPSFDAVSSERQATAEPSQSAPATAPDRAVIRKATLELATPDVRGTFLKCQLVLNEALGEYIENSSLTGEDKQAYGTVTLRITANRLSEALNQLRPLGQVVSESAGGQDVTQQVVDLDARLRNEQRIETELLALLSSRKDAPLKDVLELHDQLARVRGSIEQLTAQRQNIGKFISLATVLMIIRDESQRSGAPATGLGGYFAREIADSWHASLRLLADAAGVLIRIIVGGAPWWLIGAAVALAMRRWIIRSGASEPAPTQ
jgi:hypothetical protein